MQVTYKGTKKRGDTSDYLVVGGTRFVAGEPTDVEEGELLSQITDESSALRKTYNFELEQEAAPAPEKQPKAKASQPAEPSPANGPTG